MMDYGYTVYAAPTIEPLSLTDAKLHLRVDISTDDTLITNLIVAAREHCQDVARRAFISQTLDVTLDAWPDVTYIQLPRGPAVSVTSLTYIDSAGVTSTVGATYYYLDIPNGRVHLAYNATWPIVTLRGGASIVLRYVAGYGAAATAVPGTYKAAMALCVGHWYENREAVAGGQLSPVPLTVDALLLRDRWQ